MTGPVPEAAQATAEAIGPWRISTALPSDRAALGSLFSGCSQETVRLRFFGRLRAFPREYLDSVLAGRPDVHDAVVAYRDDRSHLVGLAGLVAESDENPGVAELGVLVTDTWQRQGAGAAMVDTLLTRARERGIVRVSACVLPGRSGLLATLSRRLELESSSGTRDGLTGIYRLAQGGDASRGTTRPSP